MVMASVEWRKRIVGHREVDPRELKRNEKNWRRHPATQAASLVAVLEEIGIVQGVIVNRTTGNIVDGHLRVDAAIGSGQPTIPVTDVELTEDEERLILATFDPIGELATKDAEALAELLASIESENPEVKRLLDSMIETPPDDLDGPEVVANKEHAGGARSFFFTLNADDAADVDRCFAKVRENRPKLTDSELFVESMRIAESACE